MSGVLTDEEIVNDPIHPIGKLRAANLAPVRITPDAPLAEAMTIMLSHDYSQLPVMTSEREVKGIVSWTSIAKRMILSVTCDQVRQCMDPPHILSSDTPAFDAIEPIQRHQYALIREPAGRIVGIVTTSDLAEQFKLLAEPFLLLGAIEQQVRWIIGCGAFSEEELRAYKKVGDVCHKPVRVADFSLGECHRLLQDPKNWARIGLAINRSVFVAQLSEVIAIRNEVMHFRPGGISLGNVKKLQYFGTFLRDIVAVLSQR